MLWTKFVVIALITECNSKECNSKGGASFNKLFKLDYEPSGFTVDGEGRIWLAQKNVVKRYTAEGKIIPPAETVSAAPEAVVTALHCLGDKLYMLVDKKSTPGQNQEQSVLMEHDMVNGSSKVVAEHLAADCRIAVLPNGKVLFMTSSNRLCQLDLGSKEVKGNTITRLTALGATTGSSFSVAPTHTGKNPPFVEVPTLQCLASDR
ncbi:hypothetical protein HaLaN_19805 [Haematococcus lacustris]|uniref:Strictosidine synthase conserved region domain-containing protein n=1 Tax=Haematococcus lacustris TaxID=44745 RepID=A0A6A0A0Q1_HAELA|nr:hypothetical protein HaLaN_19805 [Haematococcus lacustris]